VPYNSDSVVFAREVRVSLTCYLINKWFPELGTADKIDKFIDALPEFWEEAPDTIDYWIRWGNLLPRHST
jgi:hypothetical protein